MMDELYKAFVKCEQKVCTDTRNIIKDSIFFALKGANFNGNQFAVQALKEGASYCVVDEDVEVPVELESKVFLVDSVLETMQKLANFHRKKLSIPFIAITGSNGKTTTKELCAAVLSKKYNVLFTNGNFNNHIGVPLTLFRVKDEHDIAIIEMGANHQKEIAALCKIAEPDFGLITNIGKAHLEGFGGEEGVLKGKTELFDFLNSNQGIIFLNHDEDKLYNIKSNFENVNPYGHDTTCSISNVSDSYNLELSVNVDGQEIAIQTNLIGAYNKANVLTAVKLGSYFKVSFDDIKSAIEEYLPTNNRSQLQKTEKGNLLVLDAYNANPSSMQLALDEFYSKVSNEALIVMGGMKELGIDSAKEHEKILKGLNNHVPVVLFGEEFYQFNKQFPHKFFNDKSSLKDFLNALNLRNTTVLIKGSRGAKLEEIVDCF